MELRGIRLLARFVDLNYRCKICGIRLTRFVYFSLIFVDLGDIALQDLWNFRRNNHEDFHLRVVRVVRVIRLNRVSRVFRVTRVFRDSKVIRVMRVIRAMRVIRVF